MKLYARTPAGFGLGINVWLTGQVTEVDGVDGKLRDVEVVLPPGCDHVVGYSIQALPQVAGRQLFWADPCDLRADNGGTLSHEELLGAIKLVNDLRVEEMRRGPLGENWP